MKFINMLSDQKRNGIIAGILIIIIIIFWNIYYKIYYKDTIIANYEITTGYLISYTISGDADNRTLTYVYNVSGQEIKRYITPNSNFYDYCFDDLNLCKGKRFHVIYSATKPKNSLIDLSHEIVNIDSAYVSKNLNKFE